MSGIGKVIDRLLGRLDPDTVVREHGPRVHRHLVRIFGPQADVDDVFQSVFLEILRSLPSFRGEASLSTWIRRITWNVAYQHMRHRYAHRCLEPLDETRGDGAEGEPADDAVLRRDTLRRLYAGLAELDPKLRLPVIMHDIEEMTLREIGEALGRPLPTVASQLYAGRAALADWMRARERLPLPKRRPVKEKVKS